MQTLKCGTASAHRCGLTLIELLIVMGILTILATISLTTVKGLLKDQKISQAARLAEQYIESARVRALTNQRPVAVYIERTGITGDASNAPVPANFTSTRLSIGEVFPPYTGDVLSAKGSLWDVNMSAEVPSRGTDGFADQIRFNTSDVPSGFGTNGTNGFVKPGDTIEFEGYVGRYAIEAIEEIPANGVPTIAVTFFNPPANYNAARSLRIRNTATLHPIFESTHSRAPTAIPVRGTPLPTRIALSSAGSTDLTSIAFRVYRRPTKSLVGAIALPRGTCIDLSASGFGPWVAGAGADNSPFGLTTAPFTGIPTPSSYSRIAIMFSAEGRLASVIVENNLGGTKTFGGAEASEILYLLVGRTDQVVPGDLSSEQSRKLSLLQRSDPSAPDPVRSNLLDPANIWITCNPFTGEIKTAPVAEVDSAILANTVTAVNTNGASSIQAVVRGARSLAIAGIREQ